MQICVPAKRVHMFKLRQTDKWIDRVCPPCVWLNMQMCVTTLTLNLEKRLHLQVWKTHDGSHHEVPTTEHTWRPAETRRRRSRQNSLQRAAPPADCVRWFYWKLWQTRSFLFGYLVGSCSNDPPSVARTDLVLFGRGRLMFFVFSVKAFINLLFSFHAAVGNSRDLS